MNTPPGLRRFEVVETREAVQLTPDNPMAPHWWRQCLTCRHEWDEHEEDG